MPRISSSFSPGPVFLYNSHVFTWKSVTKIIQAIFIKILFYPQKKHGASAAAWGLVAAPGALGPMPHCRRGPSSSALAHFCRRLGARGAGGAGRAENARSARQALGPASATRGHSGAGQMITDTVFFCLLFQCDFRRKKKYRNLRGRTRKSRPVPRRL